MKAKYSRQWHAEMAKWICLHVPWRMEERKVSIFNAVRHVAEKNAVSRQYVINVLRDKQYYTKQ
jgi:hypothetical protein